MESTLLKTVTFNEIRLYLWPAVALLFFIPFAIYYFLKFKPRRPFYPFSMADYSLKFTKDKLFQIEDRLSFLRLLMVILLALTLPAPALLKHEETRYHRKELPPKEGSVLFLLLDQSGSMGRMIGNSRMIDKLKALTIDFIERLDEDLPPQRKDLIGLMGFARVSYVIVPPTFEHDILIDALDRFDVVPSKEGEGSSLSYAIYKTAHLIQFLQEKAKEDTHFNLDSSAILLVTDGVEVISPEDVNKPYISISMDAASNYAAKYHIPLYLVVIFPQLNEEIYAPQKKSLQNAAKRTGGELFILNSANELSGVLKQIEDLKRVSLGTQGHSASMVEYPLWPYLLWTTFFLLLLYLYLEYHLYRMAP